MDFQLPQTPRLRTGRVRTPAYDALRKENGYMKDSEGNWIRKEQPPPDNGNPHDPMTKERYMMMQEQARMTPLLGWATTEGVLGVRRGFHTPAYDAAVADMNFVHRVDKARPSMLASEMHGLMPIASKKGHRPESRLAREARRSLAPGAPLRKADGGPDLDFVEYLGMETPSPNRRRGPEPAAQWTPSSFEPRLAPGQVPYVRSGEFGQVSSGLDGDSFGKRSRSARATPDQFHRHMFPDEARW
mmetsp:Transcript_1446/g.3438  ORF Transcript_1446/g.3438 Transcript_1446/m.3438 type:complete len:244 (+) Transcript_1446:2-733(+)